MDIMSGKIARRTIITLIIAVGSQYTVFGQAFKRAQLHIDTLCAERFHGRGYGFDGHTLAAHYIANEFKELGLKPVYPDYFHPFPIKANVFEGDMEVSGLQEFVPGTAFIPDVATPNIEGAFQVVYPDVNDAQNLKKALKKKGKKNRLALVIDTNWYANKDAMKSLDRWLDKNSKHMVIKAQKKLTWGTARWQKSYGSILMTYDVLQALGDELNVNIDAELKTIKSQNVVGMIEGTEKFGLGGSE